MRARGLAVELPREDVDQSMSRNVEVDASSAQALRAPDWLRRVILGAGRGKVRVVSARFCAVLVVFWCVAAGTSVASAVPARSWSKCSKTAGNAAAAKAGVRRAMDNDRVLKRVFDGTRPSSIYRRPSTSLCADFNGDGRLDRALHYQCCTVSSPAPWVVLRGGRSGWRIAYKRLSDTTFRLEADGRRLSTTEPKYDFSQDALCCPSQLRIGTLRWTGSSFKRTFVIKRTPAE